MIVVPLVAWGMWIERAKICIASLKKELEETDSRLVVYTTHRQKFPEVETRHIPNLNLRKHKITTICYQRALEEFNRPLAPIAADMVCSTGTLTAVHKHHKEGKRLVCAPVPRVNEKTFPYREGEIKPRDLASLALDFQHPRQVAEMFVDKLPAPGQPTSVFRRVGNTLQANCFHMHPILFNPRGPLEITRGIDGSGVNDIPDELTHVVTDSDECLVVDVSDPDYNWNGLWNQPIKVVDWAKRMTLPKHRRLFQNDCYIHSDGVNKLPPDERIETLKKEVLAI